VGLTGATGPQGPIGLTGAQGIQGIQGVQGVGPVTIADAAPASPTDGMLWMRTTTEIIYLYSSAQSRWIIPYALDVDRERDSDEEFMSLNLQFSRDKTLIARRGPTPVFTRASTATFVGSNGLIQSAAINAPRFDHDPVTGVCKGLLIEEPRTNLAWYARSTTGSGNLTPPDGSTLTNNFGVAPDGTTTTALIADNSIIYSYGIQLNASTRTAFAANSTVCGSIYIRKKTSAGYEAQIFLSFAGGEGGSFSRYRFNYVTGVALITGELAVTSRSVSVLDAGDFWRISITAAPANGSTQASIQISPASFNTMGVADVTLTGDCEFWGNQVEVGAFPTSLIITSGSPLTRSADVCSVTTAGWSNAGNDTMLAEYFVRQHIDNAIILEGGPSVSWLTLSASPTSLVNRLLYRHGGTATRFDAAPTGNYSLANINKLALTSGEQLCLNGSLGQAVTSDPGQLDISTILSIGRRSDFGGANYLNGPISAIRYYKKRLTNFKLQSLTS
jgi:hypothetical protein